MADRLSAQGPAAQPARSGWKVVAGAALAGVLAWGARRPEAPEEPKEWSDVEPAGVPVRRVLLILFGWVVFVSAGLYAVERFTASQVPLQSPAQAVHPFPQPQLQTNPPADLAALRAAQTGRLEGYAWTDQAHGLVHIPIERAMEILAARGQAGYDPLEATAPDSARGRAIDAAGGTPQDAGGSQP